MNTQTQHIVPRSPTNRSTPARNVCLGGLGLGAAGIAILWAAGQQFPFIVPPGILILLAGMAFVAMARWPWAPYLGSFLGAFVIVGFLISPDGIDHLVGSEGGWMQIGQVVQVLGVVAALVAGLVGGRANYRRHA